MGSLWYNRHTICVNQGLTLTTVSLVFTLLLIAGYVKIFSHNTAGGLFLSTTDALSKNTDNPTANLFSILNKLENYRDKDGNFQFKLCYPEVGKCNEWIQSSNPAKETTIRGFRAISLDFTKNGAGRNHWIDLRTREMQLHTWSAPQKLILHSFGWKWTYDCKQA